MERRHRMRPRARMAWSVVGMRVAGIVFVLGLGVGAVRLRGIRQEVMANMPDGGSVGVVLDVSPSVRFDCGVVQAEADGQIGAVVVGKGSKFVFVSTGDEGSAYFPKPELSMPLGQGSGGPFGGGEVMDACARITPTERSPIAAAIRMAVEQLKSYGCNPGRPCGLVVLSDLQETMDPEVVRRLNGQLPKALAPLIDNTGITVTLCGFSTTQQGGTTGLNVEPLLNGWKSVFTEEPRFRPYCGS